jgi:hypothetical protein
MDNKSQKMDNQTKFDKSKTPCNSPTLKHYYKTKYRLNNKSPASKKADKHGHFDSPNGLFNLFLIKYLFILIIAF